MTERKKKRSIESEYKVHLENFYEKHKWYRHLVFLSRIARMVFYLLLGISAIFIAMNGGRLKTFESLINDLIATPLGKVIAIIFGFLLIIYGIEKPRG